MRFWRILQRQHLRSEHTGGVCARRLVARSPWRGISPSQLDVPVEIGQQCRLSVVNPAASSVRREATHSRTCSHLLASSPRDPVGSPCPSRMKAYQTLIGHTASAPAVANSPVLRTWGSSLSLLTTVTLWSRAGTKFLCIWTESLPCSAETAIRVSQL